MSEPIIPPTERVLVSPPLDAMLTREQAAEWLQVSVRWLAEDAGKTYPEVPVFKVGHKTSLYHVRTIIAHRQEKAKIPVALTAASFGFVQRGPAPQ